MKQNISITDLNELSEKNKNKLREWWIKHIREHDIYIDTIDPSITESISCCEDELDEDDFPLLSIGQMIEFLEPHLKMVIEHEVDMWIIDNYYNHRELCDALWQAVKEVLEK